MDGQAVSRIACPEDELLVCCARTHLSSDLEARLRSLALLPLDWEVILKEAAWHRLLPLLYRHLRLVCPDAVPAPILDQLQTRCHALTHRNLLLSSELLRLWDLFTTHQIPAAPYKGPLLAQQVYGDLALRPFNDLDILVHREDVPRVKEVLLGQGYLPQYKLTAGQETILFQANCEYNFYHPERLVIVEVHWEIVPPYFGVPLNLSGFQKRLETHPFGGRRVASLAPEDLLLALCLHGVKHFWLYLGMICDVAELLRRYPDLDWERTLEQARRLRSLRALLLGLFLASDLLDAPLAPQVSQALQADAQVRVLAEDVRRWLFTPTTRAKGVEGTLEQKYLHLRVRETIPDRISYIWRALLTPDPEDCLLLPAAESYPPLQRLLPVLRPFRLARKYLPTLRRASGRADRS